MSRSQFTGLAMAQSMVRMRRVAYVDISYAMLGYIISRPFTAADWTLSSNLPKDARVYRVMDRPMPSSIPLLFELPADMVRIYFESDEFAEVPEGAIAPAFNMIFTQEMITEAEWMHMWKKRLFEAYSNGVAFTGRRGGTS